jgi:hypothetical protein
MPALRLTRHCSYGGRFMNVKLAYGRSFNALALWEMFLKIPTAP